MANWLPLRSNPHVMNRLLQEFGVEATATFVDVYGLEQDLLALVPQPVMAIILLFPLSEKEEEFKTKQEKGVETAGQQLSKDVFFMRQYVGNACGTVAVIHAIANNVSNLKLNDGLLKRFLLQTKDKNPKERGHDLYNFVEIAEALGKLDKEGHIEASDINIKVCEHHFITFVNVNGGLYELDGRKKFPINHGSTSKDSFLLDSANVCRSFIDRNPDDTRFSIIALSSCNGV